MQSVSSPELQMSIQPKIIDHLGINMYTNLHAVISELIANSWDADAKNVYIDIPAGGITDEYKIVVKDDGMGMTFDELNDLYLQVGRNKRESNADEDTAGGRKVIGRKGIGKFAVFGVAKQVIVKSIKNGFVTEFSMEIDKIKNVKEKIPYKPDVIRTGKTNEEHGVTVTLLHLKRRKNPVDIPLLRHGIAGRFTLFNSGFMVHLNSDPITEKDAVITDVEYTWPVDEIVSDEHKDWKVTGTIWSKKGTIREIHNRGVAVFARGKLVQEPTFFGATSGKEYAYDHIFGKLHAEFIDGTEDAMASNRSLINVESEAGQVMTDWGKKKLTDISIDWSRKRVAAKTKKLKEMPAIKDWFDDLNGSQQKMATKIFESLTANEELPEETMLDLAGYVKDIFKYDAFQELASEIQNATPEEVPKIIELFKNWEHLEASEMHRVLKGRISTINKLETFIKKDAREVPTIHEYLKKFPWILDPRWTIVYDEAYYSTLLKKKFPETGEAKENRRIDFLCFSSWPSIIVVELKRPGHAIGKKDLEQLSDYVDFVEANKKGTDPETSGQKVYGYLICENQQKSSEFAIRKDKLAGVGIYVRQYSELLSITRKINDDFITKYEEIRKITKHK